MMHDVTTDEARALVDALGLRREVDETVAELPPLTEAQRARVRAIDARSEADPAA